MRNIIFHLVFLIGYNIVGGAGNPCADYTDYSGDEYYLPFLKQLPDDITEIPPKLQTLLPELVPVQAVLMPSTGSVNFKSAAGSHGKMGIIFVLTTQELKQML